jgi:hypothetical protein
LYLRWLSLLEALHANIVCRISCFARQRIASALKKATALYCCDLLLQVIEQMGNWALRGVMFNMCMPVTAGSSARHTPLASRSDTPEEEAAAAAAAMKAGAAASSSSVRSSTAGRCSNSSVLDAAGGCAGSDVAKRLGQQELGKQQAAGVLKLECHFCRMQCLLCFERVWAGECSIGSCFKQSAFLSKLQACIHMTAVRACNTSFTADLFRNYDCRTSRKTPQPQ